MKTIGIQIKSTEAILVVLEKDEEGKILQTGECCRFSIDDDAKPNRVKQFRDQMNSALDSIGASRVAIVARNGKGDMAASAVSFKLEGIIQLYDKLDIELIWKQTTLAYFKKNEKLLAGKHKYQEDAFDLAYYLMK